MTPTDLERLIEPRLRGYLKLRETKGKPNRHPVIDAMVAHCGAPLGSPWCSCFVCRVVWECGMEVPVIPKLRRTASALRLISLNPDLVVTQEEAVERLLQAIPTIYVQDHGGGKGHAGVALRLAGIGCFQDISGNTSPGPGTPAEDREGDGCYERTDRRLDSVKAWLRIA